MTDKPPVFNGQILKFVHRQIEENLVIPS